MTGYSASGPVLLVSSYPIPLMGIVQVQSVLISRFEARHNLKFLNSYSYGTADCPESPLRRQFSNDCANIGPRRRDELTHPLEVLKLAAFLLLFPSALQSGLFCIIENLFIGGPEF